MRALPTTRLCRSLLSSVLLLAPVASASAQTSGILASESPSLNWSTAPWVITAGAGTYPDSGGTATFNSPTNTIIGTPTGSLGQVLTLNVPVTLSSLVFNTPFVPGINASGSNGINLTNNGAILDTQLTRVAATSFFAPFSNLNVPLSGGGTSGLTKTGSGSIQIFTSQANTYTGGTHINGGTLFFNGGGSNPDICFGATGVGNGISFNGGTLAMNNNGSWITSREIFLAAGGGTLQNIGTSGIRFDGIVSGSGDFYFGRGNVEMTAANTYTGATTNIASSILTISSANGTINQSSRYDFGGTVVINNGANGTAAANNNDRLSDTAPITLRGATLSLTGNSTVATTENAGAVALTAGNNTISMLGGGGGQTSLNFASIARLNNATLLLWGTGLGATQGAFTTQIRSAASPGTLIGGGGAAGSTNISILPWAVGNTGNPNNAAVNDSSFVTWNSTTGAFRPLATSEFASLASGANTDSNTRVTAATAISAPTTVNSVLIGGSGTLLTGTGGLNITSGALMYAPGSNTAGTVSANVNFGSAEGVITNTSATTFTVSGVISGSGGLTLNPLTTGSTIALGGANVYTGQTTLVGGTVTYGGIVPNDVVTAGPFGRGTSAIVLNLGTNSDFGNFSSVALLATGASVFNRDLTVGNTGSGSAEFGTTGSGFTVTMNGNISLQGSTRLVLRGGSTVESAMIVNGNISGTGSLKDSSNNIANASFNILNGINTYSGGTIIQRSTFAVGSNSAFGSGTITFADAGTILNANTTARTITNDLLIATPFSVTAANSPTFAGSGALNFSGGVNLNGVAGINVTNTAPTTFSGVVSNGSLTKFGAGTLIFSNPTGNTYTGGTVVSAGTLLVNNTTGSDTGSDTVAVKSGATLGGSGTIAGATQVQSGGTLAPGDSGGPGRLTFQGGLSLASGATLAIELSGTIAGVQYDELVIGGGLTLDGSTLNVSLINGFMPTLGEKFFIADRSDDSVPADGDAFASGAAIISDGAGNFYQINYFDTDPNDPGQTDGNDISLTVVPEPGSVALLLAGGLGLLAAGAFQRRAAGGLEKKRNTLPKPQLGGISPCNRRP